MGTKVGAGEENFVEEMTTVREKPAAPGLEVVHIREKTMNVTIRPAEEGVKATHFYIQYKRSGDKMWRGSDKVTSEGKKEIQLRNLEPGTKYRVRIAAFNRDEGKGKAT